MTYIHKTIDAITGEETTKPYTKIELDEMAVGDIKAALKQAADKVVTNAKASRDAKLAKMGFTLAEIENW